MSKNDQPTTSKPRTVDKTSASILGSSASSSREIPEELFDGYAVYNELTRAEKKYTSAANVSAVLDAVVSLIRKNSPVQ